jgi:hypothetical protein
MRPVTTSLLLGGLLSSLPAQAQDTSSTSAPGAPSKLVADIMAPGPFTMVPPPVHGPQYGEGISDDFTLTYHGYLSAVMLATLGEKQPPKDPNAPIVDKAGTPIHSLNLNLPDAVYNTWLQTLAQPGSWGSFTMGIGTAHVQGTILIGAWNFNQGQQVPQNATYAQTALSFYPGLLFRVDDVLQTKTRMELRLGGTGGRYGTAGKYDSGLYGTPIVGGIFGLGQLVGLERDFGDITLRVEEGLGVNGHGATGGLGTTLTGHTHVFASYKEVLKAGAHYMVAWTQDERIAPRDPDGSIKIIGADARFNGGILGELFVGGSYVKLTHAQHVDGSIQTVHVSGGQAFMDNFLGEDTSKETGNDHATGSLRSVEVQYDYSLGALARYPENFWGDGPDLRFTLFGMYTQVGSFDPQWDHVKKLKFGAQVIYSPLSFLQVGARVDRVIPNLDTDPTVGPHDPSGAVRSTGQNFSILSPKVTLRSKFAANETVSFQYSHYFYGTTIEGLPGVPITPKPDLMQISGVPSRPFDSDVFSIQATMWF